MPPSDTPDELDPRALEGLLRWYVAMGVDGAIGEISHDCFAMPPPAAPGPAQAAPRVPVEGPSAPADALIRQAEEIAGQARSLIELRALWDTFEGCALAATASGMIFADGNPHARIMVIGAAPGSDDERQGEAFAGPAGRLLDGMLRAIGLSRETAYLANVIPWRPPGNRPPTALEAALCLPFTRRHIALAAPELILCLGERAAQLLLDTQNPLSKLRGRWLTYEGDSATAKLAVTFSLDYLLSQPLQKKRAWLDLIGVAKILETSS